MPAKKKTIKKKEIYNGRPLNKKELSIIVWLYTSDPQHRGIVERVLRDYRQTAAGRKGVRVEISRPTVDRLIKEQNLEAMRLQNVQNIREKYRADGESLLDDKIKLTKKMLGVVVTRLLGDEDKSIEGVIPRFSDYDRMVRLGCFLAGGPDSRPDTQGNTLNLLQIGGVENLDSNDLDREIAACDKALQAVPAAPKNRL